MSFIWRGPYKEFGKVDLDFICIYIVYFRASMQQLSEAVYMLEWALPLLEPSLITLTQYNFHSHIYNKHG